MPESVPASTETVPQPADAFSEPVAALSQGDANFKEVQLRDWIEAQANLTSQITWRRILNSHMIRSKRLGGPICVTDENIADVLKFEMLADSALARAELLLPNSFEPSDGAACGAFAVAETQKEAEGLACKKVTIDLMLQDVVLHWPQSKMVLKPKHWKIRIADINREISRDILAPVADENLDSELARMMLWLSNSRRFLEASYRRRAWLLYQQPAASGVEERAAEVEHLLSTISRNEGDKNLGISGWARPERLRRLQWKGRFIHPWTEIARLVEPGTSFFSTLLRFLQDRLEKFDIIYRPSGHPPKLHAWRNKFLPHVESEQPVAPAGTAADESEQPVAPAETAADESEQPVAPAETAAATPAPLSDWGDLWQADAPPQPQNATQPAAPPGLPPPGLPDSCVAAPQYMANCVSKSISALRCKHHPSEALLDFTYEFIHDPTTETMLQHNSTECTSYSTMWNPLMKCSVCSVSGLSNVRFRSLCMPHPLHSFTTCDGCNASFCYSIACRRALHVMARAVDGRSVVVCWRCMDTPPPPPPHVGDIGVRTYAVC